MLTDRTPPKPELLTEAGLYITEVPVPGPIPLYRHPQWSAAFPWLVQGTTSGGPDGEFDLRLSGDAPVRAVMQRWHLLREELGAERVVHAVQVHGRGVASHEETGPAGLTIVADHDGHATRMEGVLLTVSVADCIPISIVDPINRAIALLHGGWRGVAAGILEEGVATLVELAGSEVGTLFLHLGPAICGDCYEVGPEVYEALGHEPPSGRERIDLRAVTLLRAERLGIHPARMTRSTYCTRCQESPFFSYRGGSDRSQIGLLGLRPGGEG